VGAEGPGGGPGGGGVVLGGGGGDTNVNVSALVTALVPPGVVTVTLTVPVPAGDVAVIVVALVTLKLVAVVEPNLTVEAPVKLVPVIVTPVPPLVGPVLGFTEVTAGGVTVGVT
jgi:hypothetical protein